MQDLAMFQYSTPPPNFYALTLQRQLFTYRQFNIQQFHVLPTHCIYVFCVDLRTNSDYFPIQH